MVTMAALKEGDFLWEAAMSQGLVLPSKIVSLKTEIGQGLYNPHTLSGSMIVNNITATTFTSFLPKSPLLHHLLIAPLAALSWLCPYRWISWINLGILQKLNK